MELKSELERTVRVDSVYRYAQDVFGDREKARQWLITENHVFNSMPLALVYSSHEGADEVRKVLSSIRSGGVV